MFEKGHFEIVAVVLSVLVTLHQFNMKRLKNLQAEISKLTRLAVEHEILIDMYCELTGRKRWDLPTRHDDGTFR